MTNPKHGFKLEKSQKFNLTKSAVALNVIRAELGWETPENCFPAFDLDVSMFGLRSTLAGPKLINEDYFVFYNHESKNDPSKPNIITEDGAIVKSPDELSGGVEWIKVDLRKVNKVAEELSFVVTIHEAVRRRQTFKQVSNAYIQIFNDETNESICFFQLDQFADETSVQVGSLIREATGDWSFEAVGAGYQVELGAFVDQYIV